MLSRTSSAYRGLLLLCLGALSFRILFILLYTPLQKAERTSGVERPSTSINATATPNENGTESNSSTREEENGSFLRATSNETLRFQKIIAIGFSDRMDKRDAMITGASLSGIELEWMEGVRPSDMSDKAYPTSWDRNRGKPDEVGAWRAHINAMQRIVANKISTALIFEDDVDWDVTLKTQLREFARGARAIQRINGTSHSPYGDSWDTLWLGSCAMRSRDENELYMIPDDPTVRPASHRTDFWWPSFTDRKGMEKSRFVIDQADGMCTLAYAVTYAAARKILTTLSLKPNNSPFDMNLNGMCIRNDTGVHFRCLAPYPQLFNSWRKAGRAFMDSDIVDLADGATTVKAQWPEAGLQDIEIEGLKIPRGRLIKLNQRQEQ